MKLYMLKVKLEDIIMAESEKDARKKFHETYPDLLEGIGNSYIECEEYDKIMESIKAEKKKKKSKDDDICASSSVCEEVLAQDMKHVNWTEVDDNGETN